MLLRAHVFVIFALAVPLALGQDVTVLYDCPQADGSRLLTNVPSNPKACKAISVPRPPAAPASPSSPSSSAPSAPKAAAKAAPAPSPANFPRVDRETQQTRDSQRKRILEQELTNEQKLLEQAKRDLVEQESVRLGTERNYQKMLDRLEPYQKKVKQHEDNIASLRKELSNLR